MIQIHQSNGKSSSLFQLPTYPAGPIQVLRILRFWRLSELTFQLCYLPTVWLWTSYLTIIIQELVMDREAWRAAIHGVTKSRTRLSDWTELNWTDPHLGTSLVAQIVKNLPAMQETWVWSLCQENALEKGMATYSSILAWRIPQTKEPGGL